MARVKINVIALNILFVVGATVVSTLLFLAAIRNESERLARVEQEQGIQTFWQLLRARGTEFRIADGKLMAGDHALNGDYELPDTVQSIFGGTATIFMGDTRVSTNVLMEDGTRAVGTKLVGPAYDAVFRRNSSYSGEAMILGAPYFTAYDPIRNSRGEVIGALYVGAQKNEFYSRYEQYKINVIAGAAIISTIFSVLAVVLLRDRKRNIETIQVSEARYRTLFANSAEGILLLDDIIFDCNDQVCRMFGYSRAEIIGRSPLDLSPEVQPDGTPSAVRARQMIAAALAGETLIFPWQHLRRDGTAIDAEVSLNAVDIPGKKILQATIRDVTERNKGETLIREIAGILAEPSGEGFFPSLVLQLAKLLEMDYAFIAELNEDMSSARTIAGCAYGNIVDNIEYLLEGTPCANVINGEFCYYPDCVAELFPDDHLLVDMGVKSYLGIPLVSSTGRTLGLVAMLHGKALRDRARYESVFKLFAIRIAGELERLQAEQALEQLNYRTRLVLDAAGEGIYGVDREGAITFVNPSAAAMLGYTVEELLGQPSHETFHYQKPDGSPYPNCDCAVLTSIELGENRRVEDELFFRRDGSSFAVEYFSSPVRQDDTIVGAVVVFADITERKRVEQTLRQNEESLARAQQIAHLGNWDWDIRRNTLACSDESFRIYGLSPQERVPTYETFIAAVHPDDREAVSEAIDAALHDRRHYSIEHRLVRPDGTIRYVYGKGEVIRDNSGAPERIVGTVQDITERKRAEESLRLIRLQQQAMLDNIPDLVWLKDTESRFIAVNAAFARACGTTPAQLAGKTDLDVWPTDLATLYREDDARVMASGEQIRTEEPLVDVSGTRSWIETIKMPIYDDTGTVIGTTGIARDISERREAELRLRENEARLAKAQQIAHVGNWDWDIRNNTLNWSDEIHRIFRIPSGQFDMTYEVFVNAVHPDDRQAVIDAVGAALNRQAPYNIRHRIVCPDGEVRHVQETGEVDFSPEGAPVRMQGVVKDITESTLAETALRESEARFREIFEQNEDAIILMARESLDIIDANRATESLIGRDKESLAWLGPWSFIVPEDYNSFIGSVPPPGDATPFHLDRIGVVRSDGTRLIASIWGKIIRLRDTEVVYCSIRDITRRIQMEEEARIAQSRLIHTNKMTSLGVLVSGIAHEINNPNTFIQGNASLIESFWRDTLPILGRHRDENGNFNLGGLPFGEVERIIPRLVHGVKEGSRRISSIVNNLKDFAREDTTKTFMPINVNKIVEDAKLILSYQIHRYTDQFRLELAEDLPLAQGKPQQIEQVVINLIMNALQALPGKGAGVTIATRADQDSPAVTITVRDEGEGMSREVLERITEPFFTTRLDQGGTGLGLSISAAIIREHNGTLHFESTPNMGTTATLTLPIAYHAGDRSND